MSWTQIQKNVPFKGIKTPGGTFFVFVFYKKSVDGIKILYDYSIVMRILSIVMLCGIIRKRKGEDVYGKKRTGGCRKRGK